MRTLLDRYWEGETTLEEERRIKAFFTAAGDDLPEEFRQEARWFRILQEEKSVQAPAAKRVNLFPRTTQRWYSIAAAVILLLCAAGLWWRKNVPEPPWQIVQNPPAQKNERPGFLEKPMAAVPENTSELAQSPVVEPEIRKPVRLKKQADVPVEDDTCEDPEQALAEIRAALALVSSKINKSKETLDKGLQEVDHVEILLKRKNG